MVTKELTIVVFDGDSQSRTMHSLVEVDETLLPYEKIDPQFYYKHFLSYIAEKLGIESLKHCSVIMKGDRNHVPCIQYENLIIQFYVS